MWSEYSPDAQRQARHEARRAARREQRAREAAELRRRRLTITVTTALAVVAAALMTPVVLRASDAGAVSSEAPVVGADPAAALNERIAAEIGIEDSTAAEPTAAPTQSSAPASTKTDAPAVKDAPADEETPAAAPESSAEDSALPAEELPVVSEGDYGDVVAIVQRMLDVEPTGYFGPKTHQAVVEYQESVGLPATGQIATFTWATLGSNTVDEALQAVAQPDGYVDGEPAAMQETPAEQPKKAKSTRAAATSAEPPVLEQTDSGESVAVVQRALGVSPATGYFGPKTDKAVRQFQADNGIPTTGVIATYTWAALGSELAAKTAAAHQAYGTVFGPGVKDSSKSTSKDKNSGGGSSSSSGNSGGGSSSGGAGGNGKGLFCPVANFYYGDGLGAARPGGRSHAGLDLMGSRGEPIYAIDSGTVTRSGYQSNGAMILDITGSRGMYFYGHFESITVGYGESVKAGQLIGYMGDTGSPGAVHLHLEVRPNGWSGGYEDPVPLIKSLCG